MEVRSRYRRLQADVERRTSDCTSLSTLHILSTHRYHLHPRTEKLQ
jgi:hypothetical protein